MKKEITLNESIELVGVLELSEKEVTEAYAFSKETVVDEIGFSENYHKLNYIEFLEFLVRCANLRFA